MPAAVTTPGGAAWWAILEASGGPPLQAGYITVQGTAAQIHAKYGTGADVLGPFATQPEAAAAGKAASAPTTGPGGPGLHPQAPTGLPGGIPNPFGFLAALGWIQEIGHWVGIVVAAVTDLHTWISIGWLTLGFWMLLIGILLWLRIPQRVAKAAKSAGEAAGAAAVVAA